MSRLDEILSRVYEGWGFSSTSYNIRRVWGSPKQDKIYPTVTKTGGCDAFAVNLWKMINSKYTDLLDKNKDYVFCVYDGRKSELGDEDTGYYTFCWRTRTTSSEEVLEIFSVTVDPSRGKDEKYTSGTARIFPHGFVKYSLKSDMEEIFKIACTSIDRFIDRNKDLFK